MNFFKSLLITLVVFLFSITVVKAADFTYPISQLGNCRDKQECFYYCEIPANLESCAAYENENATVDMNVLGASDSAQTKTYVFPIAELGNCATRQECYAYCNNPDNKSVCLAFAQAHQTKSPSAQGQPTSGNSSLAVLFAQEAKRVLGCDYATTCRTFCNVSENKAKCSAFVKSFNAGHKSQNTGTEMPSTSAMSLDCSNPVNRERCVNYGGFCGTFCQRNPSFCNGTYPTNPPKPSQQSEPTRTFSTNSLTGPVWDKIRQASGCKNDQDCYNFCNEHGDTCRLYYSTPTPAQTNNPQ